jgi:hypothetical protein
MRAGPLRGIARPPGPPSPKRWLVHRSTREKDALMRPWGRAIGVSAL